MKKKKLFLLLFALIVSIVLILTNFFTIKVLSAVRAYINGESEYSKGQKDASLYLVTYVETDNPDYWQSFKKAISAPKGDQVARVSLLKNDREELTKQGFLMGHNHPEDIPDMIWLFKTFDSVPFMKKAITIWAAADATINELDTIGERLNAQITEAKLTAGDKLQSIKEISLISTKLSQKESAFSEVLGDAAGQIKKYLQYANVFLIVVMLGLIALYAINMINKVSSFEKALKAKINELNTTNKQLGHFTHVASHDLQEPLRMVTGFLSLLQKKYEGKLDKQAQSYIHFAVDGAVRMRMLIHDLLEYASTSVNIAGYVNTNLNKIISDIKLIFQDSCAEPGAGIFFSSLPEIKANQTQMMQLFQNLVSNAIKYRSASPPEIYISATSDDTHWIFSVKDNGMGIDSRYYDKIFIIFQRLQTNATHQGTGIGLAICKKIVEQHGGRIWIESEIGKGSNFLFTISKDL